jgi:hypothetical protein
MFASSIIWRRALGVVSLIGDDGACSLAIQEIGGFSDIVGFARRPPQ